MEIVTSILVLFFLYKAKQLTQNHSESYDEDNVTPSDYTLYFEISKKLSNSWDSSPYYQENMPSSRGE